MKEHGILMTPENYPKCADGRKTMTRRIAAVPNDIFEMHLGSDGTWWYWEDNRESQPVYITPPLGMVGDRLYVKEGLERSPGGLVQYRLYPPQTIGWKYWTWKRRTLSPLHMPKDCARLWLEITSVKVERLQEISEEDCIAEGIALIEGGEMNQDDFTGAWKNYDRREPEPYWNNPDDSFHSLWASIHGPGSWTRNDWVWVYGFKRVTELLQ